MKDTLLDKINDGHIKNGIDIKNGFKGKYIIKTENNFKTRFDNLKNHIKKAENIWLASDLDREGAAIAWHIKDEFKLKNYKRIIFNEITSEALSNAILNPTKINMNMVDSQQARRFIDRIVGFDITGLLWKEYNTNMKLSTGRVQSACLNIIINKEKSIKSHKSELYYSLIGNFVIEDYDIEDAKYCIDKKINKFTSREKMLTFLKNLDKKFKLESVDYKIKKESPPLPFITSTLQQTASSQLKMSIKQVMSLAQELYEGGFITYMRTDCYNLSSDFQNKCLRFIKEEFGDKYVGSYKSNKKSKGAQEAHEAIRVTKLNVNYNNIKGNKLTDKHKRLYDLIWKRTLASQMKSAIFERTAISLITTDSDNIENIFRANFQIRVFSGFQEVYDDQKSEVDTDDELPEIDKKINVNKDDIILCNKVSQIAHDTEPPPRYNAASLIKTLEELGIGRPSTYASILSKLSERNYTQLDQRRISPTSNGRLVTAFLENYYPEYVQYDFTADLENKLDKISNGDFTRLSLLEEFWKNLDESTQKITNIERKDIINVINETLAPYIFDQDLENPRLCPECGDGTLTLLSFKDGSFVGCSNYPECKFQRDLSAKSIQSIQKEIIAIDPTTKQNIILQSGRYGPYLELENIEIDGKPKRASIPKNINIDDLNEKTAIQLISLPRIIGNHPDTNEEIIGAIGRYGPYLKHMNTYVNKIELDEIYTIGLNRAVSLINEQSKKSPTNSSNKNLGKYPNTENDIILTSGRYGPYIKYDRKNYSISKDYSIDDITLDDAIQIISSKAKKK